MKKIRLDIGALEVASFTTAEFADQRGTVKGNSGYTCYVTVAVIRTQCAAYPVSYWGEDSCACPPVRYTDDPRDCPPILQPNPTIVDPTCPGVTGC